MENLVLLVKLETMALVVLVEKVVLAEMLATLD